MQKKIKKQLNLLNKYVATTSFIFLFVMPFSTNYKLRDYGFGSGGSANSTAGTVSMDAIAGEISNGSSTGGTVGLGSGLSFTIQSNVPLAPTFTNPSNYYNKLHLVIDTGGNPSDTKFAIAISSDNFVTTNYVKLDHTVGATLVIADYQTYTNWGGAGGFDIIGLTANTTYKVKVKAMQGKFTETGYGPVAAVATVNPTLSFGIRTDTLNSPPFILDFGTMVTGSVNTGPQKIWADVTTNSANGVRVYVSGANAGLKSVGSAYTISSVTGDLTGLGEGFGAQGVSVTQTSGGPFALTSPYSTLSGNVVGIVDTNIREIFNSPGPIGAGSGSFQLKSKPATTARPASDYTETLTMIAAGSF